MRGDAPGTTSPDVLVDFIITLDGYASGAGWPGWWGLQGPEYLDWLRRDTAEDYTTLLGANTYRLFADFTTNLASSSSEFSSDESESVAFVSDMEKIVFSSTLEEPTALPNTQLVRGDAVEAVAEMKRTGTRNLRTLGSLSVARSLLTAGLVDRYRVVVFPVITGATGSERIFDGYPDVALTMIQSRTFDAGTQLLEYVPTVLDAPPLQRS
jgi:dihydrofolate reductase